jgi:NADH-quinone oxidoreductase subunit J
VTILQGVFVVIAVVTLVAAVMVVGSPNLIHAALWLVLTLGGVAILFLLLEASFLAVVQVAIYIGAIAILVIFAVMLTRSPAGEAAGQANRYRWLAAPAAVVLFAGLIVLFSQVPAFQATPAPLVKEPATLVVDLGRALVEADGFVLPFEVASVLLLAAMIGAIVIALPPAAETNGASPP